jgi:hypothetical protein
MEWGVFRWRRSAYINVGDPPPPYRKGLLGWFSSYKVGGSGKENFGWKDTPLLPLLPPFLKSLDYSFTALTSHLFSLVSLYLFPYYFIHSALFDDGSIPQHSIP